MTIKQLPPKITKMDSHDTWNTLYIILIFVRHIFPTYRFYPQDTETSSTEMILPAVLSDRPAPIGFSLCSKPSADASKLHKPVPADTILSLPIPNISYKTSFVSNL